MHLSNFTELAQHYKKTERTISNWKRDGAPIFEKGINDTDEIDAWLKNKITRKRSNKTPPPSDDLVNPGVAHKIEQTKLAKAKRRLAQYELQIKQGKLVAFDDVRTSNNRLANEIRRQLETIPNTYKDHILNLKDSKEGEKVLKKMVDEVLVLLHRGGK